MGGPCVLPSLFAVLMLSLHPHVHTSLPEEDTGAARMQSGLRIAGRAAGKSSVPDCRLLRADTVALLLGSPGDPGFPGGTPCSGLCLTATGLWRKKLVRKERFFLNMEERKGLNFISCYCGDRLRISLLNKKTQNENGGT